MKELLKATVKEGKLVFSDYFAFKRRLAKLEGKTIGVDLKTQGKTRSVNQNRYLWGYIIPTIMEFHGYDDNDTSAEMAWAEIKIRVGHCIERETDKGIIYIPKDSKLRNTEEFESLMSSIRSFYSCEFGLFLAKPNEECIDYE